MPLNAFECELSQLLCCAHEFDEERSKLCEDGLLTLTVFPLTLRLNVLPLLRA